MKKIYISLLVSCSLFTTATHAQTTLTVRATKDASLYGCAPCGYNVQNFGSDVDVSAIAWTNGGIPSNSRGLFAFDLSAIPENAIITDAKLSLYHNPTSGNGGHSTMSGSNACIIQRVTQNWNEDSVTWDTQPTTTDTNEVLLAESSSATDDYLNMDVKNLIIDMLNNPTQSFGMMLRLQDENAFRKLVFASSDYANSNSHPKLEITYLTYNLEVGTIASPVCAGQTISLAYTTSTNFNNGNQFVAQLSDSLGDFANAIQLDTVTATGNGTFQCTIPSNIQTGIGYRIRALATNPSVTGSASNPFVIGAKPVITAMVGDTAVRTNNAYLYAVTSRPGSTFVWSFINGSGTSTTNSIAITWTTIGQTKLGVLETSVLGCKSDTFFKDIQITDPVGLEKVNGGGVSITVFPNPGNGLFAVQGLQEQAIIRDMIGNETFRIEKDGVLDLTAFPSGVYFIQSGLMIQKIVKY